MASLAFRGGGRQQPRPGIPGCLLARDSDRPVSAEYRIRFLITSWLRKRQTPRKAVGGSGGAEANCRKLAALRSVPAATTTEALQPDSPQCPPPPLRSIGGAMIGQPRRPLCATFHNFCRRLPARPRGYPAVWRQQKLQRGAVNPRS